jgi:hypothetical protein
MATTVGTTGRMCDQMIIRNIPILTANPTATATATSGSSTILSNAWTFRTTAANSLSAMPVFVGTAGTRTSCRITEKGYYDLRWKPVVNMSGAGLYAAYLLVNGTIASGDIRYVGGAANGMTLSVNGSEVYNAGDVITFQLACTTTSALNATTITMQASALGTFKIAMLIATL